jgi:prepilin-type N-terminal cleavage/methylation domain-containing protein
MNITTPRKAFTLIELLIVITIVGILSTLLFRTLGDMISANGRIQQEKIMTQELITIQTTINNLSEHYPMIDIKKYITNENIS